MAKLPKIEDLKKKFSLSELESQIIGELIQDPRKTFSKMAGTLNKNRATITKKFNRLLEDKIIKISIDINLDYFRNEFYLLRISLKSLEYANKFFDLLRKCPKIVFISHSFIDNSYMVILRDEVHEALQHKYFSCMHLIEEIQEDPNVDDCHFDTLLSPIAPNYISLDESIVTEGSETSPCDKDCEMCMNYLQTCTGCPATTHYRGELKFSL